MACGDPNKDLFNKRFDEGSSVVLNTNVTEVQVQLM